MARAITLSCLVFSAACGGVSADDPDGGATSDADLEIDATGESDAAEFAPNIVFVTSTQHSGSVGGLSGADSICNAAAIGAGLEGNYLAWLSTEATNARDRLGAASGWIRPDGQPFGNTIDDILAGQIFYPANLDQNAKKIGGFVWTATNSDGTYSPTGDCGAWSSETGNALLGDSSGGMSRFTNSDVNACAEPARLLCFGADRAALVEAPAETGRLAFVSAARAAGNQGVDAFDSICATEASAAGFAGVFSAAVFANGESFSARFDLEAETWVRPDGVRLFEKASDLREPTSLLAPIQVGANGITYDSIVWTGESPGIPRNCEEFTNGSLTGTAGVTSIADSRALFGASSPCGTPLALYCFER